MAADEAVDAGVRIMRRGRSHIGAVVAKGDRDFATAVDLRIESVIKASLADATPGIAFLGEGEVATSTLNAADGCSTRSTAQSTSPGAALYARSRCRLCAPETRCSGSSTRRSSASGSSLVGAAVRT